MTENSLQAGVIKAEELREKCFLCLTGAVFRHRGPGTPPSGPEQNGAEHGRQSQGDDRGEENGNGQRDCEFPEKTSGNITHEKKGDEHGHKGKSQGDDGESDLAGTDDGGLNGFHALLYIAGDILDDDDGVVDNESGGDDQGHEREVVEGKAREIHDAQRADEGQGDGHGGDHGGPRVAQEDPDDDDNEDDGEQQLEFHVLDSGAYGGCPVCDDLHVNGPGQGGLEGRQFTGYGVGDLDYIGSGLALHGKDDGLPELLLVRAAAVHRVGREQGVFRAMNHVSDIFEPYGRAIGITYDGLGVLLGRLHLIVGIDGRGPHGAVKTALGRVDVGTGNGRADVRQREICPGKGLGIDLNADGRLFAAGKRHEANAGNLRDFLGEPRVGQIFEFCHGQGPARDRKRHDGGIRGVDLVVNRRVRQITGQKGIRRIDAGLNLLFGNIELSGEAELQRDDGRSGC